MMGENDRDDAALEAFFDAARAAPPAMPAALADRIAADALAAQSDVRGLPVWRRWLDHLGGAPGLGGLVTATCVGVWIGVAPPAALPDLGALVLGNDVTAEAESFGFGWDIEEG